MSARPQPMAVSASDLLPTAAVIHRVKALSWEACCDEAYRLGWPVGEAGLAVIRLAPGVAQLALGAVCPEVPHSRLARCLRLDPLAGLDAQLEALVVGPWPWATAETIARQVENELKGRA